MVATVTDGIADYVSATPREESVIIDRTVQQMRLIALGMGAWRPPKQR